jgi:heterodisulfide reductase subunit B
MKYSYYPGCSLEATSIMYDVSTRAVFETLGAELVELEDWNCCGATAYMSVDELMSMSISARNLAIAEKAGLDLITPCSGCFVTLTKTNHYYHENGVKIREALSAANMEYKGTVEVRHIIDPILNDIGLAKVEANVKKKLKGLKVASYHGCQLVRPYKGYDDAMHPRGMDDLMASLGATPIDFDYKAKCCGGAQMGTDTDLALSMVEAILKCAKAAGAEVIACACPLCQMNLEAYQGKIERKLEQELNIPIIYFTQLMAFAFDHPKEVIQERKHIVPFAQKLEHLSV